MQEELEKTEKMYSFCVDVLVDVKSSLPEESNGNLSMLHLHGRGGRSGSNAPLSVDFDVAGKIAHDIVDLLTRLAVLGLLMVPLGSRGRYANFVGIWRSGSEVSGSCCV